MFRPPQDVLSTVWHRTCWWYFLGTKTHLKSLQIPELISVHYWLLLWTPLKNISQLGLFPIYGKIKNGNQTTNQINWYANQAIFDLFTLRASCLGNYHGMRRISRSPRHGKFPIGKENNKSSQQIYEKLDFPIKIDIILDIILHCKNTFSHWETNRFPIKIDKLLHCKNTFSHWETNRINCDHTSIDG